LNADEAGGSSSSRTTLRNRFNRAHTTIATALCGDNSSDANNGGDGNDCNGDHKLAHTQSNLVDYYGYHTEDYNGWEKHSNRSSIRSSKSSASKSGKRSENLRGVTLVDENGDTIVEESDSSSESGSIELEGIEAGTPTSTSSRASKPSQRSILTPLSSNYPTTVADGISLGVGEDDDEFNVAEGYHSAEDEEEGMN
jgi:hypothetical protein